MSLVTKEMPINEDVTLRVTLKNYYIIVEVSMIFERVVNDKLISTRIKIQEPYLRFTKLIELCKKIGSESERI